MANNYGKDCGSLMRSWHSNITTPLATPPPGLGWMSLDVWKCFKYLIGWTVYLLLGAAIFMKLEEQYYQDHIPHPDWKKFKELLTEKERIEDLKDLNIDLKEALDLKEYLMNICNHTFINQTFPFEFLDEEVKRNGTHQQVSLLSDLGDVERTCKESLFALEWVIDYENVPTFINAMYYTITLLTTIGYGHFTPLKASGKMFCVVYGLFGIPLTYILLNTFSELLLSKILQIYKRSLTHHPDLKDYLLYIFAAFFILMGFIVFMFIPAIAFMLLENLSYSDSFYYTFVTVTTIGFGDIVAGYHQEYYDVCITVYKLIIIIWIMSALGYLLLVIKFIMKASKTTAGIFSKTFSSAVITEHATSFKELVQKVGNRTEDETLTNGMNVPPSRFSMVDLMNGVEGVPNGNDNDKQPIIAKQTRDEDAVPPLSLIELLGVKVVISNDDAVVMKNIVIQASAKEGDGGLLKPDEIPGQITLTLRDALNLVYSYQQ